MCFPFGSASVCPAPARVSHADVWVTLRFRQKRRGCNWRVGFGGNWDNARGRKLGTMWRLKAALAAVVFLSVICGSAAWAQSGLLLGLGRPCLKGRCETVYRTLWIAPHGGTVQIVELPDLIVPRRMGFWRVGVRTYCDPNRLKDLEGNKAPW